MNEFDNKNETVSDEYAYKTVMGGKAKTRLWSVIALFFSIVGIAVCFFGWWGLAFSTLGLVFAVVSRKSLGYFDKITLGSIIVSIFAAVFSIAFVIINTISA